MRRDDPPLPYSEFLTEHASTAQSAIFTHTLSTAPQIKLLKFLSTFGFGGTERQVVNLVRHLDRSRFDLNFACTKRWGQFLIDIEQQQKPIAEYCIKRLYLPGTVYQQLKLAANFRRQKIQISHSYNFYANVFAIPAAKIAGVPVVIASIRDTGMGISPAKMRLHKLACRYADCVLVNAEAIREWLIGQGYNAEKINVIQNGIDQSRFKDPVIDGGIRREYAIPEHAPIVIVLARLSPQKGIDTFLQAAAKVNYAHPDTRFIIVGDLFSKTGSDGDIGPEITYQRSLAQMAVKLGIGERVIFTGYRSDIPALLSQANVSVLPSHSGEGLSNSLLESMAAGLPVVATHIGGSPEVIGENGKAGILVAPRDADALSQAICAVLEDDKFANHLGEAAKQRVAKYFSLESMVAKTEDLYVKLLEQAMRRRGQSGRVDSVSAA